ncbi:GntR family transcriptional regulator [Dyadobacter beijingensis]|uniref:GntR family transcriptional regulator n=1 Tax=Dyadobacter beijingensis TaxID=365489 RepID=A0ABQ2IHL4_9BACT|nr:PLP-dependent aminotransferase family protein [Dyadobacter beijingensis]GGN11713.1 GntR family transcriptional regulator [Dyadobacter beijingensis]
MLRPWELVIPLDRAQEKPVYMQIADAVIVAIQSGKLVAGSILPGSRQLAAQLNVNRNTIVEALDVLAAEGWLVSKERRGIFVADVQPLASPERSLVRESGMVRDFATKPLITFDDGLPDSAQAPIDELARAYRQIFARKGRWQMMGYRHEAGDPEFREAIAQMLNYKRGMRLSPDQVFITRGSQMAMFLAAHALLKPGDHVLIENPGYKPAWEAFTHAGARLLPVNVDAHGIVTDEIRAYLHDHPNIKAVYITPHHQFPTTVTLNLRRRMELVALSNEYGFTIIEDDYDHEFHFSPRPVMPVSSLEQARNYVYIGTMSKIVAPALRIGYLASCASIIDKVTSLRKIIDVQGDYMMEQAVFQLIHDGEIRRHLKRTTPLYKSKRDFFETLIREYLADKVHFTKPEGGLAFWLTPKAPVDLVKLAAALRQKGIALISPDTFCYKGSANGLRLGYASLSEEQMQEGIQAIAANWPD